MGESESSSSKIGSHLWAKTGGRQYTQKNLHFVINWLAYIGVRVGHPPFSVGWLTVVESPTQRIRMAMSVIVPMPPYTTIKQTAYAEYAKRTDLEIAPKTLDNPSDTPKSLIGDIFDP